MANVGGTSHRWGWVKLTTYKASKDDAKIGCGGIIQRSNGEWLDDFPIFLESYSA